MELSWQDGEQWGITQGYTGRRSKLGLIFRDTHYHKQIHRNVEKIKKFGFAFQHTKCYDSLFFYYLALTARQDYFTHFELSHSLGGVKMGDPRENHLTTHKQNLACLT